MVGRDHHFDQPGSTRRREDAGGSLFSAQPGPVDSATSDAATDAPTDALNAARTLRLRLVGAIDEPVTRANGPSPILRSMPHQRSAGHSASMRITDPRRTTIGHSPRDVCVGNIANLTAARIPSNIANPAAGAAAGPNMGEPIREASDPRWVLAVRTAESLEGTVLRPEKRERLVHLGKILGLSPFDANLVIAIVQDQARRGFAPSYCPTAGEPQLRLVPLPHDDLADADTRRWRILMISGIIGLLIGLELVILKWILG